MRHIPGEVWFLPPEAEEGGDPKDRRHVLLAAHDDGDDGGIFAYASTQPTETRFGAAHLLVDPARSRSPRVGFTRLSYVYPARLVPAAEEDLVRMTGRLDAEMSHLRAALRRALGLASTATEAHWRGRVVRIAGVRAELIDYRYGVVVTEPAYSRHERYQIIVPIDDADEFEPAPGDIVVDKGDWFIPVAPPIRRALFAISDVQSVFHPRDIDHWTGAVVDPVSMRRVDQALVELFGL